ncbi:hypothetical protein QG053_10570, partial [Kingella kingae]|nr:hypothetical protein [Kingella kingae]
ILMQAKGGVGKSVSAYILAQYLRDSLGSENCAFLDTDPKNNSFAKYQDLDVAYLNATVINPDTGETKVDAVATNAIFETVIETPQAVVMDTGSSNYIDLKSYLEVNEALEVFNEEEDIKREVIIHVPVNGGSDFSFCCDELGVLFDTFKTAKFVVWLNSYGGKLQSDGKEFDETKIAKDLAKSNRFLGIVLLPQLDQNQAAVFREIMANSLTFEEARLDGSGKFTILKKRQINKIRERFYKQLDDIFPEFAEKRAALNA